jgi:3-hydroxyisobutyrate dehydrogenase
MLMSGFPMARNLRAKLPADDVLFVQDVNKEASSKFLEENPTGVRIADSVREVAEKSVSYIAHHPTLHASMMIVLFYP